MTTDPVLQEMFDISVSHLRRQGRKSQRSDGLCMYRQPMDDGTVLMCAAGPFIPDDRYDRVIEGRPALSLWNEGRVDPRFHSGRLGIDATRKALASTLQNTHDNWLVDDWEDQWRTIATSYDLAYTPPEGT